MQMDLLTLAQLLQLPGFEVVDCQEDRPNSTRFFTIVPVALHAPCPDCGRVCHDRHECLEQEIHDLPMAQFRTILRVRHWQFHCKPCDRFFTPPNPHMTAGTHATTRLLERAGDMARHSDLASTARFFAIPEKSMERWFYAYLTQRPATSAPQPIRSLGIDEISLKKDTGSTASC